MADLSSVWVILTVYQKDLPYVHTGDTVQISVSEGGASITGEISYISPILESATRTASARIVLPNRDGQWRPGLFVNGTIETSRRAVALCIPKTALQTVENKLCVFVLTDEGFEPHPVTVGRSNTHEVEITEGLQEGQHYVVQGAFTLKAQLEKGTFNDGHAH